MLPDRYADLPLQEQRDFWYWLANTLADRLDYEVKEHRDTKERLRSLERMIQEAAHFVANEASVK